ncbi:unnamed protein product [Rotaria sordida]|uniref:eRF1 domain-containing protein n=1 Tax=Rotaria sordida TaxID=392033 RepID=A0A819FMN4_9BILA|nr:unnamed protein product [Rotaria sordida]
MQEMKMTSSCVDQEKYTDFDWEHIEEMPLLEWFVKNHKKFGATLEIVTDKSQQGYRFVHDFDGIGGSLLFDTLFFLRLLIFTYRYSSSQD